MIRPKKLERQILAHRHLRIRKCRRGTLQAPKPTVLARAELWYPDCHSFLSARGRRVQLLFHEPSALPAIASVVVRACTLETVDRVDYKIQNRQMQIRLMK
eukprot:2848118-Rhodomonas_salina.1